MLLDSPYLHGCLQKIYSKGDEKKTVRNLSKSKQASIDLIEIAHDSVAGVEKLQVDLISMGLISVR